ncbi:MAG: HAD family phosphatase [Rhodoferax sp.]|uniref:HAD family hydrolase n=1 Tax=Rhodoferax sp. TaxID=50421 RepID=UPI0027333D7E|nr:HAD family phosphatase [Rhodoferax sp.]MDP2680112.1 HAD family phosphatase [Rhodoferax sp.]
MAAAKNPGGIEALIFDMDGTMIDSMGYHAQSWALFADQHGLHIEIDDLMRRTTGRTGAECMRELFQRDLANDEACALIAQKEQLYRELFGPVFAEVAGFKSFYAQALARDLKLGVGTAGDQHNIAFAMSHLQLAPLPKAIVGGDEGHPGKPEPAIFLEVARQMNASAAGCIVFEDAPFGIEAARRAGMQAVAICSTHTPAQLAGPHVIATVRDYHELLNSNFLETLHVATS